jgi:hypothetical protein
LVGVLGAAEAARLLSEQSVPGSTAISPREFLGRLLGPQLQYGTDEKDLCVMRTSSRQRRRPPKTVTSDLIIERDLKSGLFGMSPRRLSGKYRGAMLARRDIAASGLLNPLTHAGSTVRRIDRARITVCETVPGRVEKEFSGDGRRETPQPGESRKK